MLKSTLSSEISYVSFPKNCPEKEFTKIMAASESCCGLHFLLYRQFQLRKTD